MTGGLPARVMRTTVLHDIGRRGPGDVVHPSRQPRSQEPIPSRLRAERSNCTAVHDPTYTGTSGSGRLRRASQTRLRAVRRWYSACRVGATAGWWATRSPAYQARSPWSQMRQASSIPSWA